MHFNVRSHLLFLLTLTFMESLCISGTLTICKIWVIFCRHLTPVCLLPFKFLLSTFYFVKFSVNNNNNNNNFVRFILVYIILTINKLLPHMLQYLSIGNFKLYIILSGVENNKRFIKYIFKVYLMHF